MTWKAPENFKEVSGFVLCTKYVHKALGGCKAIPNKDIKGKYEIMCVDKETKDYFYGMPLEGLGLVDCMISKKDCRPFDKDELTAWQNRTMGMYGSHSGNLSYTYKVSINDLMNNTKEKELNINVD